ncbi:MAG: ATP-binding cassette domain-containing protein [Deltaproteobacteria bacterium]|nr:ATP-binding cassette domain-containing protein [Deltaproteobacteria bacterium]
MIHANSITVSPGAQTVLSDFSLRVQKGEKVALNGPSGSGKSTLLKTLIGMHQPSSGTIELLGMAFVQENLPKIRRRMFYLPQDVVPKGDETVLEYLKTPFQLAVNRKMPFPDAALEERFAALRLKPELLNQPLYSLSGGERKRVGLLAGLLLNRDIILADEPTAGVDPANRDVIGGLLFGSPGVTVLAVTHDEALLQMADRCVTLPEPQLQKTDGGTDGRP